MFCRFVVVRVHTHTHTLTDETAGNSRTRNVTRARTHIFILNIDRTTLLRNAVCARRSANRAVGLLNAIACQKYRTQGRFNLNETRTAGKTSALLLYGVGSIAEKQNYRTTIFGYNNRN